MIARPYRCSCSSAPRPAMAAGIKSFREALGNKVGKGYIVHPGDIHLPLGPGIIALPFMEL